MPRAPIVIALFCLSSVTTPVRGEPSARFEDVAPTAHRPERPDASAVPSQAGTSKALGRARECPEAHYRVVRAERLLGEHRSLLAMGELSRAIKSDPRCGSALLRLAGLRVALGDYGEAERLYARAVRLKSVADEALYRRSLMRRSQGRTDEALRDLEAYAALAPRDPARLEVLATVYIELKAWPAALAAYRRIANLHETEERAPEAANARIKVRALSLLAAEADPVSAGGDRDRNWVRRAMARLAEQ